MSYCLFGKKSADGSRILRTGSYACMAIWDPESQHYRDEETIEACGRDKNPWVSLDRWCQGQLEECLGKKWVDEYQEWWDWVTTLAGVETHGRWIHPVGLDYWQVHLLILLLRQPFEEKYDPDKTESPAKYLDIGDGDPLRGLFWWTMEGYPILWANQLKEINGDNLYRIMYGNNVKPFALENANGHGVMGALYTALRYNQDFTKVSFKKALADLKGSTKGFNDCWTEFDFVGLPNREGVRG